MLKLNYFISLLLVFFAKITTANSSLHLKIIDDNKQPIMGALCTFYYMNDSTETLKLKSNIDGLVQDTIAQNFSGRLTIQYIGFQTIDTIMNLNFIDQEVLIELSPNVKELYEVKITAQKKLLKQVDDKIIIDPEVIAGSTTNSLEILEQTPGVVVGPDGNIYVSGLSPAKIYINDREQKLSTNELSSLLKNISPKDIEKIELVKSPSAKYGANSSGGIVNIVLKRSAKLGKFGSLGTGLNLWKYHSEFINLNFQQQSYISSFYISLNLANDKNFDSLITKRGLNIDTQLIQNSFTNLPQKFNSVRTGVAYSVRKNLTISLDVFLSQSKNQKIIHISNSVGTFNSFFKQSTTEGNFNISGLTINPSFNVLWTIDTSGSSLNFSLDYQYLRNKQDEANFIHLIYPEVQFELLGDRHTQNNNIEIKLNYTKSFNKNKLLETGTVINHTNFASSNLYDVLQNSNRYKDSLRSNTFDYQQIISAAYIQYAQNIERIRIKLGGRLEKTIMNGVQLYPSQASFKINQNNFFPYLYLSRELFKIFKTPLKGNIILRRTILRPDYAMLNPAIQFVDVFLYTTGNPNLKPQITQQYEFNVSFDDHPVFTIGKKITENIFNELYYTNSTNSNINYKTFDNTGKSTEYYFQGMAGIPPGKKYFFIVGGEYNHTFYNGYANQTKIEFNRGSLRLYFFQKYNPTPKLTFSNFMFLMDKGYFGFYEFKNFGGIYFNSTYKLFKNKADITFYIRDALFTSNVSLVYTQTNINAQIDRVQDSRRIGFKFNYYFGEKPEKDTKKSDWLKSGLDSK